MLKMPNKLYNNLDDEFLDQVYLAMAEVQSLKSLDPSTKVGAVIVKDKQIIGAGYNSFPHKCCQEESIYDDRPRKYLCVVHAEVMAVLKAGLEADCGTLYVWPPSIGPSCGPCSAVVVEAGITRVVYVHKENPSFDKRWGDSIKEGLRLYKEANVAVDCVRLKPEYEQIIQFIKKATSERISAPPETN